MRAHDTTGIPTNFGTIEGGATFEIPRARPIITMQDIKKRRRMCSNKTRFATAYEAKYFTLKRNARLRAYRCPHCGDWHLTRLP